jgi:hypothetical protein
VGVVGTSKPKAWLPKKKIGVVGTSNPKAWLPKKKVGTSKPRGHFKIVTSSFSFTKPQSLKKSG